MVPSYDRFLRSKEAIDHRSLNQRIFSRFTGMLAARAAVSEAPLELLEVGAGVGSMAKWISERMAGVSMVYTLLDRDPRHLEVARVAITRWLKSQGIETDETATAVRYRTDASEIEFRFVVVDLHSIYLRETFGPQDALVGQAVLDLLDLESALQTFMQSLKPGGLCYFPITYDGLTYFGPIIEERLDERLARFYDETMDQRASRERRYGGSRSGRRALELLTTARLPLLDAGSSDWVVVPGPNGYSEQEIIFLQEMLHFFEMELTASSPVPLEQAADWLQRRRRQIDRSELILMTHQLDLLAQVA